MAINILKDFFQNCLNSKGNIMNASRGLDDRKHSSSSSNSSVPFWLLLLKHSAQHWSAFSTIWNLKVFVSNSFRTVVYSFNEVSIGIFSLSDLLEREGGRRAWPFSLTQHVGLTAHFLRQECNLAVAIDRFPSPLPVDALRRENVEQNGRSQISLTWWGRDGLIAH